MCRATTVVARDLSYLDQADAFVAPVLPIGNGGAGAYALSCLTVHEVHQNGQPPALNFSSAGISLNAESDRPPMVIRLAVPEGM